MPPGRGIIIKSIHYCYYNYYHYYYYYYYYCYYRVSVKGTYAVSIGENQSAILIIIYSTTTQPHTRTPSTGRLYISIYTLSVNSVSSLSLSLSLSL